MPSLRLLACLALLAAATDTRASTVAQNVAWTIDRPGTVEKRRIVVYGDSIFAGYYGSISSVAIQAAPTVDAEYASHLWGTDVEVIRRCKSGAKAGDVYRDKIVDDASWMKAAETRVVAFEMCGNDALQARSALAGQGGTCDYSGLATALDRCTTYLELAMVFINENAAPGVRRRIVGNLYYPGYDADDALTKCDDPETGQPRNKQDIFLPLLLRMNWRACDFASRNGFRCADGFAGFMGADHDSNGDGVRDRRALRFRRGETEDAYVTRLATTLRATIRDPNRHATGKGGTADYILSDDVHPTYTGGTVFLGLLGGSGSGSSAPRFEDDEYRGRRNPLWKRHGHERYAHAFAVRLPRRP